MPRITDTSEYKFNNILEDEDKQYILKLVYSGFRPKYIAKRFGLTWEFIERQYHREYKEVIGIHFDSKTVPYYDNENSYGKNTHHYTIDSLSQDEVEIFYEL